MKNKLFPAQEESEKIICVIRKHWFAYVLYLAVVIFMAIPLVILLSYYFIHQATLSSIWGNVLSTAGSMYFLSVLGLTIYGFIDRYLDIYIITDRRIVNIVQNGFFHREISEVNLRQIQDVTASVNGVFPTLLHFGNVHIETAGDLPNFTFESIPHPYETSKRILDLHEAYVLGGTKETDKQKCGNFDEKEDDDTINETKISKSAKKDLNKELNLKSSEIKSVEGELKEGKEIDL